MSLRCHVRYWRGFHAARLLRHVRYGLRPYAFAMRCPVLRPGVPLPGVRGLVLEALQNCRGHWYPPTPVLSDARFATVLSAYTRGVRCAVLTAHMILLPGSEVEVEDEEKEFLIKYQILLLSYAIPTPCPVLTLAMLLPDAFTPSSAPS
eukprot:2859165-Rhodomonas_salina.3